MNKPLIVSDSVLCLQNFVDPSTIGTGMLSLTRLSSPVYAAPNVISEDIIEEVLRIQDRIELGIAHTHEHLSPIYTTLTEYTNFVAVLSYEGFIKVATGLIPNTVRREAIKILAEELVYNRDNR